MKQCFRCGEVKALEEFYRHPKMADGHLGKCKFCTRRDVTAHRAANVERIRAYDRARGVHGKSTTKDYAAKYPQRRAAQIYLNNALRDGRITAWPRCALPECRSAKVHGHHVHYGLPLDVTWLCPVHHKAAHKMVQLEEAKCSI